MTAVWTLLLTVTDYAPVCVYVRVSYEQQCLLGDGAKLPTEQVTENALINYLSHNFGKNYPNPIPNPNPNPDPIKNLNSNPKLAN